MLGLLVILLLRIFSSFIRFDFDLFWVYFLPFLSPLIKSWYVSYLDLKSLFSFDFTFGDFIFLLQCNGFSKAFVTDFKIRTLVGTRMVFFTLHCSRKSTIDIQFYIHRILGFFIQLLHWFLQYLVVKLCDWVPSYTTVWVGS